MRIRGRLLQVLKRNDSLMTEIIDQCVIEVDDTSGVILSVSDGDKGPVDFDFGSSYLMPGFIDCHSHFPQLDMIGAYAGELLGWLREHTFPHEMRLAKSSEAAKETARAFCRQIYRNGISTAVVFASSCSKTSDQLFEAFYQSGGRLISGKISMDQNAPVEMLSSLGEDLQSSTDLIQKWHGRDDRIFYALTPRFAPSCSSESMRQLSELKSKFEGLYTQTHVSENVDEVAWVKSLFPQSGDYLGVYEDHGLLDERTLLAHGIYLSNSELRRIAQSRSVIVHCPSSNLFLGSGLLPYQEALGEGVSITLGSDIGAGTDFSMWQTMSEAIKISKLRARQVDPEQLFYDATLGAAHSISLGSNIGSIEPGKQADIQVIDPSRKELLERRLRYCEDEKQLLSAFMFLCDDRNLKHLFIKGRSVYQL